MASAQQRTDAHSNAHEPIEKPSNDTVEDVLRRALNTPLPGSRVKQREQNDADQEDASA